MFSKKLSPKHTKAKKGNISILVIFVLLASGIIGILTMHFVRQILHYNGTVLSYYKSYYLAQAGLELSLAQTTYRSVGFEYSVHSTDSIIQDNFDCYNCGFTTNIFGTNHYLNKSFISNENCSENNAFTLSAGESLVLPLYKDTYSSINNANIFGDIITQNLLKVSTRIELIEIGSADEILISISTSTHDGNKFVTLSKKYDINSDVINEFLDFDFPIDESIDRRINSLYKNYLIIGNPSVGDEILQFCLKSTRQDGSPRPLSTEISYIKSIGNYGIRTLGLEAIYQHNVLPSFLGHTTLD